MKKKFIKFVLVILISLTPLFSKSQYVCGVITAKFNPGNQLEWERFGGSSTGANIIYNSCTDINSNVYIVGKTNWGISFGEINFGMGLFAAKYDSMGNLEWANSLWGGAMGVEGIVADSSENIYVMGRSSTLIVADTCWLEGNPDWDYVFIAKYNKYGAVAWIKSVMSRDYWIKPEDISINEKYGHLYITGYEDSLQRNVNNSKLIVAKYDLKDCKLLKEISITKNNGYPIGHDNAGYGITNDGSSIYVTGTLRNKDGRGDIYIAKLDTALNIIWEKQSTGKISLNICYDIAVDDEKKIYVTGFFTDSITIGDQKLIAQHWSDLFIAKLTGNGEVMWAKGVGTYEHDFGYSICFDNKNSIYVSGYAGKGAEFTASIHTEKEGPFLAKLGKDGDYEFVKSFYSGYDNNNQRGTGFVSCDKNGNLYFATHFLDSLTLGSQNIIRESDKLGKTYPNPCHSSFRVNLGSQPGVSQLTLFNLAGQTVKEVNYTNDPVDVSGLPPGIYILNVKSGEQVFREKLMIK